MQKDRTVSTDSYKGVRDFYPEDQFIQRYIFEHMERICELFGYEEYNASILENADLYRAKTSEEIVNDQTYTFTDRGDREVTLRPEMTPSFARMIAAKGRDIALPARWYCIQNFFRYERPQHGRLREFWQMNADMVGSGGVESDAEIITLAYSLMRSLGASDSDFEIRVSDRRILDNMFETAGISSELRSVATRLLDRRDKIDDFKSELSAIVGDNSAAILIDEIDRTSSSSYLEELRTVLGHMGVTNIIVDTKITRGFDYYTGMVFEVFDTNPTNRRSMMGGGRYDNLLSMFDKDPIPTVGFAMGDVTARDFLESHNLLPAYTPSTELMICIIDKEATTHALRLAQDLRTDDIAVAINFSGKKIGDQIKQADKLKIPFIIAIGNQERESGKYTIKNLATSTDITLPADRIAEHLFSALG